MPSGKYFVSDGYGNSRVIKFSADDKMLMQWGSRGTAIGEFHTPHIITHDEDGRLYISDRENDRVLVYDQAGNKQGQLLDVWAEPGQLGYPHGVTVAPDGTLYISETNNSRLLRARIIDFPERTGRSRSLQSGKDGGTTSASSALSRSNGCLI